MCQFVSWIEKGDRVLFLTKTLLDTRKGQELEKWANCTDLEGHGAIRHFFGLTQDKGINRECTDFSSPDNFPDVIVKAIKNGQFEGFGTPDGLLTKPAWAEYEKIKQQAWVEYEKIKQQAWVEYKKIKQQAWAEYEKIEQPALAEYEKIEQQAWVEYEKIRQQALAEYEKIEQQAWVEYEKIRQPAFWGLATIPSNRTPEWR